MNLTVVRLGTQIAESIVDQNVNFETWEKILQQVQKSDLWQQQSLNQHHKVYSCENLTYDKDLKTLMTIAQQENQIKTEIIPDLGIISQIQKTVWNLPDIPPINQYYNVYEVNRSLFSTQEVTLILEHKTYDNSYESYEIMLECFHDDLSKLKPYLDLCRG